MVVINWMNQEGIIVKTTGPFVEGEAEEELFTEGYILLPDNKWIERTGKRDLSPFVLPVFPSEQDRLYFAYGANLDPEVIKKRCPYSKFVDTGEVIGHKLSFTRKTRSSLPSKKDSWLADIIYSPGEIVWGAIYQIPFQEMLVLDGIEGNYRSVHGYQRMSIEVLLSRDQITKKAWAYFVKNREGTGPPARIYMEKIINGAKHHDLPKDYIDFLKSIETIN
ncbi:MAG: gamma-glutamylcyclotransferase [Candidatus Portnoybacteria bacterium]|nr:gamma-glutamylcyclotransferase [Candidatus Portnoybacteria bacterium]